MELNDSKRDQYYYKVPDWAPKVVAPRDIDEGAKKLEPPKIMEISLARNENNGGGGGSSAITQWRTPYNRPAYQSAEHLDHTRAAFQYFQQGRFEDAERLFLKAHHLVRSTKPTDINQVLECVENLAWVYYTAEKYLMAEPYVAELVLHRKRLYEPNDRRFVASVDQLAEIYEKTERRRDALVLHKFLLAVQEDRFGRVSLEICPTLKKLAEGYISSQSFLAAESQLLRVLAIYGPVYGRTSLEASTLVEKLADVYKFQGRFDKAAEMLERLLHILESIHGENGLSVASCLLKLANLLTSLNMHQEAEPLYRRVCSIYEKRFDKKTSEFSVQRKRTETDLLKSDQEITRRNALQRAKRKTQHELPTYGQNLPFTISFIDSRSDPDQKSEEIVDSKSQVESV